ncbi:hypothetical protein HW988_00565 [Bdellovibrio sp. KM01]|nr:hypothetical protein HW988_00565 [Bdellovibrio sp. KM01]
MSCFKFFAKWLLSLLVIGLVACADQGSSSSVIPDNQNQNNGDSPDIIEYARGSIKGRDWKYVQGRAVIFKRNNKNFLEIRLWNERFDNPCAVAVGTNTQVRMYAPYSQGTWRIDPLDPFSLIPTVIFSDYSAGSHARGNLIADQGAISVNTINKDMVSGVVQGRFTPSDVGATHIYGRFSVPLCTPLFGSY